ncbi:MAG: hypothetical protein A2X58_02340 [Nitrospirae bacterium GWC2_56_14]|nr:MAG: hypothetical protein A2X58_02340 [Nitrospirae bacterium GWC2_56_14]
MNNLKQSFILNAVIMTVLLPLTSLLAIAAQNKPMKPELAAKKEMIRTQREQRPTDNQRRSAAEKLKAERLKVYKAKQLSNTSN